ncbi:MAG: class I SAM-dependent methyltransferase [Sulfurimonas sp.]|nr:class I SAM-dependent methyltransferase [Sulfurimonas sp.]
MPRINNEKFYTLGIQKYGITAKGVNWTSTDTQRVRFKTILEMLPSDLSSHTIVDAGCGFGDFYIYLEKRNKLPKRYIGIDCFADMQIIASAITGCEIIIADIVKDEIPDAGYIVCSGAMNILKKFETYQFIQNCYQACEHGFIFNILHGDDESDIYNYITTKQIKHLAKELGVDELKIKTGYIDDDITVGFFRKKHLIK